ncbi:MAG: type II secretion system F family protein [Candidatus Nanoarchaeia archaeon]|nr:type II secretion system F family protein [Candidatus Haiyanarchaeum thermophilum]MCW1303342.1 type II secretion system F family protein [Candidatus Haiyanarchaeum thermophilum]MCW1304076.1 type II secretion system F family protein [Candidatus Haiyanarchaeum thermophilum]MCW1306502.1 type II secretion system F family protein [Candidatus Haiyanarchaeum thermophilum]MCW1307546.1 type II secretion system F family protein [Candidatus Haiyanarchaeum thermophilum]
MILYEKLYSLLPKFYRRRVRELIRLLEYKVDEVNFIGFITFVAICLSLISFFLTFKISLSLSLSLLLLTFLTTHIAFYSFLNLQLSSRASFVEKVLPDALLLIASNIRAGLTPDEAIIYSCREEFGPLARGLRKAAEKLLTGESTEKALREIPKVVKSRVLEEAVDLLIDGIRGGGEMATLLESIADDLRNTQTLKSEMRAIVRMYVIFTFLAATIISPLIYSLVSYLLSTLASRWQTIQTPEIYKVPSLLGAGGGGVRLGFRMDLNTINFFFLLHLITMNFFAALVIGLIERGSEREGIRYVPITIGLSLLLFFSFKYILQVFLSSILT